MRLAQRAGATTSFRTPFPTRVVGPETPFPWAFLAASLLDPYAAILATGYRPASSEDGTIGTVNPVYQDEGAPEEPWIGVPPAEGVIRRPIPTGGVQPEG